MQFVCLFTGAIDPLSYHKYYFESRGQDIVGDHDNHKLVPGHF